MPAAWTDDGGTPLTTTSGGTSSADTSIALGTHSQNAAGRLLLLAISRDNASSTTPSVTSITKPGGESNSWVQLAKADSSQATANGGCITDIWAIETSVNWDGHTVTATISSARNERTMVIYRGIDLTSGYTWATRTAGSGTSTSGAPSATVNSVVTDDLVVYGAGNESNTTPELLAGYTDGGGVNHNNGTVASSNGVRMGFKAATSSANVTVSPTCNGDSNVGVNALTFTASGATVVISGNVPMVTGTFAIDRPAATVAISGNVPMVTGALAIDRPAASTDVAGNIPMVTGAISIDAGVSETVAIAGNVPQVTGSFALDAAADTLAFSGDIPQVTGSFDIDAATVDPYTCADLNDAVIIYSSATIVADEIVAASAQWPHFALPLVLDPAYNYRFRVTMSGGDVGSTGAVSELEIAATSSLTAGAIESAIGDRTIFDEVTGPHTSPVIVPVEVDDPFDVSAAVDLGNVYPLIMAPKNATVEAVCYLATEIPAEIVEPEPVEVDTDIVETDPVDQAAHEAEWHVYPAVGTLAEAGARDTAFVLDVSGNAVFKSKARLRDRIFAKNGEGAWDITVVNGKRTQMADYQLMKPFTYGVGSLYVPGLNPILDDLSAYPWLAPWTKILVQRVDDEGAVVETDYRSRVASVDISGADVTLGLGGMFTGPASVQWRPKPLIRRRERPTYWLHASFRKCNMPLDDVDLGFSDITSPPQGWHLSCDLDVIAGAVKSNGDTLTVAYDETDKKFAAALVDRETIHATVYLDHGYMKPDLQRDFSAEKNEVYAAGFDENGGKILFAVAPGMDPYTDEEKVYPLASGDPFGEGTVDADTTDGAGISRLIMRLIGLGLLDRDDKAGGFDADVTRAVTRARVRAKLSDYEHASWWGTGPTTDPLREMVDEDLWDYLFDVEASGFSMKESRIRPAYEAPELGKYNFTATGQFKGLNPHYDASVLRVSEVVDFTTQMRKGQMRDRARRYVFAGPNWVGSITAGITGVIAGEHNPGDPFTEADVISTRDVREGWNLWVPNFEGGILFHVSGVDVSGDGFTVRFTVDTQARDALTIAEILDRRAQEKMSPAKRLMRSGNYTQDTITGYIGEIGGKLNTDVRCPAGQWTVVPLPVGDYGLVQQIRTRLKTYVADASGFGLGSSLNDGAEGVRHCVKVFGQDVRANNDSSESPFLDNRQPDPFASGDFDNMRDAMDDYKDKRLLGSWGGQNADDSFEYCGFGEFGELGGGPLTGTFIDSAGFPFEAPDCVLYLAIYPEQDAVALAGRYIWWQLDEGT